MDIHEARRILDEVREGNSQAAPGLITKALAVTGDIGSSFGWREPGRGMLPTAMLPSQQVPRDWKNFNHLPAMPAQPEETPDAVPLF